VVGAHKVEESKGSKKSKVSGSRIVTLSDRIGDVSQMTPFPIYVTNSSDPKARLVPRSYAKLAVDHRRTQRLFKESVTSTPLVEIACTASSSTLIKYLG